MQSPGYVVLGCAALGVILGGSGCAKDAESAVTKRGPLERPPVPVELVTARRGSIASYYVTTATLEAEKTASILARVQGVVQTIHVEEGDSVRRGAPLLQIENAEYRYRRAQASASVAGLKDRFERLKTMANDNLVATEELETVRHELASAEAEQGLSRLTLSRTTVTAPFAGRIVMRLVDVGATVSDGTQVFVLADTTPLLARVFVPSKEFKRLLKDQPVELRLDSNRIKLEGKVKLVSPIIDPTSGTIKVTVEIASYPEGTRPGDFAEVRIVTERRDDAILVPRVSVVEDRSERVVFVADGDTVERRVVEIGFQHGEDTQLLSGVKETERVVVKGQHSLKDGSKINVIDRDA